MFDYPFAIFRPDADARTDGRSWAFANWFKIEREAHVTVTGSVAVADVRCVEVHFVVGLLPIGQLMMLRQARSLSRRIGSSLCSTAAFLREYTTRRLASTCVSMIQKIART